MCQVYISLKLEGCIDDKEKLAAKYHIPKESIKTITETVLKEAGISAETYAACQDKHNGIIQHIKNICTKEREDKFGGIKSFYKWYIKYDDIGTCCYCGVHKDDANKHKVFDNSKRGRGQTLEVERVVTFPTNDYHPSNCRLACHICNNAKSDFLCVSDFQFIAKGIHEFWENKLDKKFDFPKDIYNEYKEEIK